MSRFSEYDGSGDLDELLAQGRWMGRRKAVLNGRPGRLALAELEGVLINMAHKRLAEGGLCDGSNVCVVGAWLYRRWVDSGMSPRAAWGKLKTEGKGKEPDYDWDNPDGELDRTIKMATEMLGITRTLAEVLAFINDEEVYATTPETRYEQVLQRVQRYLRDGVR